MDVEDLVFNPVECAHYHALSMPMRSSRSAWANINCRAQTRHSIAQTCICSALSMMSSSVRLARCLALQWKKKKQKNHCREFMFAKRETARLTRIYRARLIRRSIVCASCPFVYFVCNFIYSRKVSGAIRAETDHADAECKRQHWAKW